MADGERTRRAPAEPRCPPCGIQGIEHILSHRSMQQARHGQPWFEVACCSHCGHGYGVFARHVFGHEPQLSLPLPGTQR